MYNTQDLTTTTIFVAIIILGFIFLYKKQQNNLTDTQKNFRKKMNQLKKEGRVVDRYGQKILPTKTTFNFPIKSLLLAFLITIGILSRFSSLKIRLDNILNSFNSMPTTSSSLNNETLSTTPLITTQKEISEYIHSLSAIDNLSNEVHEMLNKYISKEHIYTDQEITEMKNRIENAKKMISSTNTTYNATNNAYGEVIAIAETQVNFINKYKSITPTYQIYQEIEYTHNLYIEARKKTRNEIFNLLKINGMNPTLLDNGTIHYYIDNVYY